MYMYIYTCKERETPEMRLECLLRSRLFRLYLCFGVSRGGLGGTRHPPQGSRETPRRLQRGMQKTWDCRLGIAFSSTAPQRESIFRNEGYQLCTTLERESHFVGKGPEGTKADTIGRKTRISSKNAISCKRDAHFHNSVREAAAPRRRQISCKSDVLPRRDAISGKRGAPMI